MSEKILKLKMEELDPTGVVVKKYTMSITSNDGNEMKEYRFLLSIGNYKYLVGFDGKIFPLES